MSKGTAVLDARAIALMNHILVECRAAGIGNSSIRQRIRDAVPWARESVRVGFFRAYLPLGQGGRKTRIKHEEG